MSYERTDADRGATRFWYILSVAVVVIAVILVLIGLPEVWHVEYEATDTPGIQRLRAALEAVPFGFAAVMVIIVNAITSRVRSERTPWWVMPVTAVVSYVAVYPVWSFIGFWIMAAHVDLP